MCVPGIKEKFRPMSAPVVTPDKVIEAVCEHFKFNLKDLQSKSRIKEYVYARDIIFYLIRNKTKMSLKSTGQLLHRDHTTVIHSIETLNNLMYTEPDVKAEVELIEEAVRNKV